MSLFKPSQCRRYYCSKNTGQGKCTKTYVNGGLNEKGEFVCYSADMNSWNKKELNIESEAYKTAKWFKGKRKSNITF